LPGHVKHLTMQAHGADPRNLGAGCIELLPETIITGATPQIKISIHGSIEFFPFASAHLEKAQLIVSGVIMGNVCRLQEQREVVFSGKIDNTVYFTQIVSHYDKDRTQSKITSSTEIHFFRQFLQFPVLSRFDSSLYSSQ